jgi:hypothetical protein
MGDVMDIDMTFTFKSANIPPLVSPPLNAGLAKFEVIGGFWARLAVGDKRW